MIHEFDPNTPEYSREYRAGYIAGERGAEGALERADARNVSNAWYDGYHDAAAGREKWTYRTWRRNGCDASCGYGHEMNGHIEHTPKGEPMTNVAARKAALFAKTTDAALIGALHILEAQTELTGDERWVRAQTIDELERRHPAASAAVEQAFLESDATGAEVDYVAVLVAAIRK